MTHDNQEIRNELFAKVMRTHFLRQVVRDIPSRWQEWVDAAKDLEVFRKTHGI